jgi:hypothetical protein
MKLASLAVVVLVGACASGLRTIPGTKVEDTDDNRRIIQTVEQYRQAMERRDAGALLAMAAKNYWENGGTVTGADDYGWDGLREVLATRFQRAETIRYNMRYMGVRREGKRAYVEVLIEANYTISTASGPQRQELRDQNQLVLEWDGRRWLFVSGM